MWFWSARGNRQQSPWLCLIGICSNFTLYVRRIGSYQPFDGLVPTPAPEQNQRTADSFPFSGSPLVPDPRLCWGCGGCIVCQGWLVQVS